MRAYFRKSHNRPLSPDELPYLSYCKPGTKRPVIVFGDWYPSLADAARATKNSRQTIFHWLRSKSTRAQYA